MPRLLVVIADRLTDLARKGELTPRYYNPGDVFDEVHLLLINDDQPDAATIRPLVGRADLHLRNLPAPSFGSTLGWRPSRLGAWASAAVELVRATAPDVIRSYGVWLNAFAGAAIGDALAVPLVVSIHQEPDHERARLPWRQIKQKLFWTTSLAIENDVLPRADLVLPVYDSARRYALRHGARKVTMIHNAVNGEHLRPKTTYALTSTPRVVSVGRQIEGRFPEHLIHACAAVGAHLTLIGDGPLHDPLKAIARKAGALATFIPAIPNGELCATLQTFDIFATHSEYPEISKAVMEAMLTGLPVIMNRRRGTPVAELAGDACRLVTNSTAGYTEALAQWLADAPARQHAGERARGYALEHFDPARMEHDVAAIYRSFLNV